MKKYIGLGAIFLLLLIAALWGKLLPAMIGGTSIASPAGAFMIPIGGIMILSGEGAVWGESSRNGMELAIKDVNESGGVNGKQLRGIYEDDGSDPKKAISAFHKLTNLDDVKFIVGPNWSNTGVAVAGLAAEAGVVMISPSLGVKEFNESSPYLFNTWQHDQPAACEKRFEELGGTVALVYEPPVDTTDERAEIQKVIRDASIDAIVMTTDGQNLTYITARQLRELGSRLPLFNITVDKHILVECGANCEGMVFPTSLTPTPTFEATYETAYGREVEIGADSAYDAVMMLAEAMRATKSEDPEKVKEYLAAIKTYNGVSGTLVSDGKRAFTKDYALKRVESGVPVDITN